MGDQSYKDGFYCAKCGSTTLAACYVRCSLGTEKPESKSQESAKDITVTCAVCNLSSVLPNLYHKTDYDALKKENEKLRGALESLKNKWDKVEASKTTVSYQIVAKALEGK